MDVMETGSISEHVMESGVLPGHPRTSLCFLKGSFILVPLPAWCFYLFLTAEMCLAEELGVACCLTMVSSKVDPTPI